MTFNFERPSEPVKIQLGDGQEYALRYTHRTLKIIKEELGISFLQMTGFNAVDEDKLPRLLYLGLRDYHETMTQDDLEDKMDAAASQYTLMKIIEAATGQNPKNVQSSQSEETK